MTEAELQELERLVPDSTLSIEVHGDPERRREGHHRRDYARDRLVNAAPALIAAARERPLAELTRLRAEFAAQAEECVRLRFALDKINAIRNSIVGLQKVNWSEHVYPLVAALDATGIVGQTYDEARSAVGTLLARAVSAEGERDRLRLLAKRLRNFLGWECPKGGEDELEAIDAEMVREGLRT